ncbi:MAG: peptidylprolyl isomerase [Deltaproteobacteria bacterium]|nr:MAG: peptidylprolyl isomerase [Deltaproteobacteria bacterium]
MAQAKQGDKVRIDLVGTLDDGTVFQSTLADAGCDDDDCGCDDGHGTDEGCGCVSGPLDIEIGAGEIFPQIEELLIGMAPGETRSVTIAAADAFGEYDDENVVTIPRAQLPDDLDPEVGEELVLTGEDDEAFGVTVVEVNAESITFDSNHPLAGEDLTFEITLREIV